jgi:hypothetical protein
MNYLYLRGFIFYIFLAFCLIGTSGAQSSFKSSSRNPEKALFGKTFGSRKKAKTKEPRSVTNAKRKQEKNEKRLKKESAEYIRQSKKRAYDIQTPEVQVRMKQNEKDITLREKEKKKKAKSATKKAAKKYH